MDARVQLNGEWVDVSYSAEPYTPARLRGHPDSWTPAEGGEVEIGAIEYETCGRALIDGRWVKCDRIVADITAILTPDQLMTIEDRLFELAKQPQAVEPD